MTRRYAPFLATTVAALLMGTATTAIAEVVPRDFFVNASGACNGALPTYEGALRKRPLAVRNEGDTSAFVSCSIPGSQTDGGYSVVGAYFTNNGDAEAVINCTFVDGSVISPTQYYPGSLALPPGQTYFIRWDMEELGVGEGFTNWPNLSCNLPPQTEISVVGGYYGFQNGV